MSLSLDPVVPGSLSLIANPIVDTSSPWLDVRDYGAGTNKDATTNTAAINAALVDAAKNKASSDYGGIVMVPPGRYSINGLIDVPSYVDLLGSGQFATQFLATSSAACIRFGAQGGVSGTPNLGGRSGHFRIWGADLATNPLIVGNTSSRTFQSIRIDHAAGDGLLVDQAQGCLFLLVDVVNSAGSGVKLDYGAGDNLFERCEIRTNGYANLRSAYSGVPSGQGYTINGKNVFVKCMFEGTQTTSVASVAHEAGNDLMFYGCHLTLLNHADLFGTNIPVFQMSKASGDAGAISNRTFFIGSSINGSKPAASSAYVGVGIDVSNSPGNPNGLNVYLGSGTLIANCDTAIRAGDSSQIEADNYVVTSCTNRFAPQSGGSATEGSAVKHRGGHTSLTGVDPTLPTLTTTAASAQSGNLVEHYGTTGLVASLSNAGTWTAIASIIASFVKLTSRGLVGTPAYTFSNDPDTGMWSPDVNKLSFSTNGTERLRVNDDGKVLITGSLGVGNSVSATTPGTVVKKIEVFDASGTSLGFIPVYNAIT